MVGTYYNRSENDDRAEEWNAMKRKYIYLLLALAAAVVLLGSCNFGERAGLNEPDEPAATAPELAVSASPYAGPDAGEYFNDAADCSLRIDGQGGFVLLASGLSAAGTYTATEAELILLSGGEEAYAYPSGEGYVLSGMAGLFLPVEQMSGFSGLGVLRSSDREYAEEGSGTYRLSDYGLQLALRYPDSMSAPENLIADAVVIWDKSSGYVTGRNVTEEFFGEAEDFMSDYMLGSVLPDFRLLYGEDGEFESMQPLSEGVAGRLASAEGLISGGAERIYVKCIMYTSTYSDGTVNYICKSFYAPEGDSESFNALANSVVNMSAVRRR